MDTKKCDSCEKEKSVCAFRTNSSGTKAKKCIACTKQSKMLKLAKPIVDMAKEISLNIIEYNFKITLQDFKKIHKAHLHSGIYKHPLYKKWSGMWNRVLDKNGSAYEYYRDNEISVCTKWVSFKSFIDDMYPIYQEGFIFTRINNKIGFEPSNCIFVSKEEYNKTCAKRKRDTFDSRKKQNV